MKKSELKQLEDSLDVAIILANDFKATIKWCKEMDSAGIFFLTTREIILNVKLVYDIEVLWSTIFHELTHCKCRDLGIYKRYHSGKVNKVYRKRMELRVERYVEREAEKIMSIYFPGLKYIYTY